jgi:hypothetical protein
MDKIKELEKLKPLIKPAKEGFIELFFVWTLLIL